MSFLSSIITRIWLGKYMSPSLPRSLEKNVYLEKKPRVYPVCQYDLNLSDVYFPAKKIDEIIKELEAWKTVFPFKKKVWLFPMRLSRIG